MPPPYEMPDVKYHWFTGPPSFEKTLDLIRNGKSYGKGDYPMAVSLKSHLVVLQLCAIKECTGLIFNSMAQIDALKLPVRIGPNQIEFEFMICRSHSDQRLDLSDVYHNETEATEFALKTRGRQESVYLYGWKFVMEHCDFGPASGLEPCNKIYRGDKEVQNESNSARGDYIRLWVCYDEDCRKRALAWANPES